MATTTAVFSGAPPVISSTAAAPAPAAGTPPATPASPAASATPPTAGQQRPHRPMVAGDIGWGVQEALPSSSMQARRRPRPPPAPPCGC